MMERFIKISYTGKVKDTGAVFDTSDAKVAKEEGLEKKGRVFKSLPLVVGAGQVITGLDEALEKLSKTDPRNAELVKLRYFAGLSLDQVAKIEGISRRTATRWWTYARAWLHREISGSRDFF